MQRIRNRRTSENSFSVNYAATYEATGRISMLNFALWGFCELRLLGILRSSRYQAPLWDRGYGLFSSYGQMSVAFAVSGEQISAFFTSRSGMATRLPCWLKTYHSASTWVNNSPSTFKRPSTLFTTTGGKGGSLTKVSVNAAKNAERNTMPRLMKRALRRNLSTSLMFI